jgi:hypothetical protein
MKRTIFAVSGVILAVSVALAGQDGKGDGFWSALRSKLEKVTPTRKSTATTAVGGVRGAKNDEAADIYWKGKDKRVEVGEDELEKFNLAVECRIKGENGLALKHFEEFLRDYPRSSLRAEGLQAVEKLKVEGGVKDAPAAGNAGNAAPASQVSK